MRIGAAIIALNESKFISYCLRSLLAYPSIVRIGVVEGCDILNNHAATEKGLSKDGTIGVIERVRKQHDPSGRIVVYRHGWARGGKAELQNRALALLDDVLDIDDWILLVGADEVYKKADLEALARFAFSHKEATMILWPFLHFFRQPDIVAKGSSWSVQMHRFYKVIRPKMRFEAHQSPPPGCNKLVLEANCIKTYHHGPMKDQGDILDRLEYYRKRDGHRLKVADTWSDFGEWIYKPNSNAPRYSQWTHSGGHLEWWCGEHPDVIKDDIWQLWPKGLDGGWMPPVPAKAVRGRPCGLERFYPRRG